MPVVQWCVLAAGKSGIPREIILEWIRKWRQEEEPQEESVRMMSHHAMKTENEAKSPNEKLATELPNHFLQIIEHMARLTNHIDRITSLEENVAAQMATISSQDERIKALNEKVAALITVTTAPPRAKGKKQSPKKKK
jgi:hypothetical protein